MKNEEKLIIITGPSGVGKGTIVKELLRMNTKFWLSISATTREARQGEKNGKQYYFLSKNKFKEMIRDNLFLEWAEFAGNYYGTPLESVASKIESNHIVILEIEVEGARQIKEKFPDSVSIFLLPPSMNELEKRIRNRGTDSDESISLRLKRSKFEISCSKDFDFTITNGDIQKTIDSVYQLIIS